MSSARMVLFTSLVVLIATVTLAGCASKTTIDNAPAMVVQHYFTAWTAKDYSLMYSLISDGFKKVEPTAASLESFKKEEETFFQQGDSINVLKAVTTSNTGTVAKVDYTIEMALKTGKQQFSGTYTLRNTATGWKLIHPYGKNVDLGEEKERGDGNEAMA